MLFSLYFFHTVSRIHLSFLRVTFQFWCPWKCSQAMLELRFDTMGECAFVRQSG